MLEVSGLVAGYGPVRALDGVDLTVAEGSITAVLGVNGAGKSTLLRVLAGLTEPDSGEVRLNPPTATVGHLPQEPERREGESVRAFLARRTGVAAAQAELDTATEALATGADGADDAYAAALDRWLTLGGADLEDRAEEVAAELGL
ncbi:ATP-binding cassette domain-containing protein, partial [Hymenobacter terrigena]